MLQIKVEHNGKQIPLKLFRNKLRTLAHNFYTYDALELIKEAMVRMNIFAANPINAPNIPTAGIIFQQYFDKIITGRMSASMIETTLERSANSSRPSDYYPEDIDHERRLLSLQRSGNTIKFPTVLQERRATLLYGPSGYPFIRVTANDPHNVNYLLARSKGFYKKDPKTKQAYHVMGRDIVRSSILIAAEKVIRGMKLKLGGYFFGTD